MKLVLGFSSVFKWFLPFPELNKYNDGYNYPKPNLDQFLQIEEKYKAEEELKAKQGKKECKGHWICCTNHHNHDHPKTAEVEIEKPKAE
jgi:hypothetical protein